MLTFIMQQHTEVTDVYLNELLKINNKEDKTEQYWFPTPEQHGDLTTYTPIQKRIFDELVELQTLENLTQKTTKNHAKHFLSILVVECRLNFMIFSPDTGLTSEQIENSKSNSHQMMIDQHIVKVFQLRST